MKNNKKNIIIAVIIGIILVTGIVVFFFNKDSKNLEKLDNLLQNDKYQEAYKIINDNNLLKTKKDKTLKLITTRMTKYKVKDVETLFTFNNKDWDNIKNFDTLAKQLKLSNIDKKYTYLNKLMDIKKKHGEYFEIIRWCNNEFSNYIETINGSIVSTGEGFKESAKKIKEYSFDGYNTSDKHIKIIVDSNNKIANNYSKMAKALSTNNYRLMNSLTKDCKNQLKKQENEMVKVVKINGEVESDINELPII